MHVLRAVEAGRPAGSNAVGAEGLDGALFEVLVGDEIVEIVRGEIRDCSAIDQFASWAAGTVA